MITIRNIAITLGVVLFTALNVFNLERTAPGIEQPQYLYDNYAYSYLMYVGISFSIMAVCYFIGYSNRLIKSMLIINIGEFLCLAIKSYFHVSYKNNYYDHTLLGCVFIIAAYFLLSKHQKNIFISIKAVLNQIYMRQWPKNLTKRRKDGS